MRNIRKLTVVFLSLLFFVPNLVFSEEPQPGEVIDSNNWKEYQEYIPLSILKKGLKDGNSMELLEDPPVIHDPKHYIEATKKYSNSTSIDAKSYLKGYVAGRPFSKQRVEQANRAEKALMIAWNMNQRWIGDEFYVGTNQRPYSKAQFVSALKCDPAENGSRRICGNKYGHEIISDQNINITTCIGRSAIDPRPVIPQLADMFHVRFYSLLNPRDISGQTILIKEFIYKDDDTWVFIPSIRRAKRMPTSQRSSTRAPADYSYDDGNGWAGKVPKFNWTYLGKERVLAGYDYNPSPSKAHQKGNPFPSGLKWFIINCYKVQIDAKDPDYQIPKRIVYISADNFGPTYGLFYDKKGQLWKEMQLAFNSYVNDKTGETATVATRSNYWDLQTGHYTNVYNVGLCYNFKRDYSIYTIQHMYDFSKGQK